MGTTPWFRAGTLFQNKVEGGKPLAGQYKTIPVEIIFSNLLTWSLSFSAGTVHAYPLDGYESTGIPRLQAQRLMQEGRIAGKKRPAGELLPLDQVDLRLLKQPGLALPSPDANLTAEVKALLGGNVDRYGIALLDISDSNNPRYAEWNGDQRQNPGSVGKLLVALALFQALADLYPGDISGAGKTVAGSRYNGGRVQRL